MISSLKLLHLQISIILLAFLALYYQFIQTLVHDWNTNENYSHGYFLPFMSALMIWSLRKKLSVIEIRPSNWGIALLAVGLLQLIIAKIGAEYFLQRTSIIVVLFGASLYLFGGRFTRAIWLPMIYLIFMIPLPAIIWNRIAFPMQLFASALTEEVVRLIGIPVFRDGNVLHLAETSLEVVDACSGLRSLVITLALSVVIGFFMNKEAWKNWVLFLSGFPIAIIVNIIRLTSTAVIASHCGSAVAQGFLHEFSGWLVFVAGTALLLLTEYFINKMNQRT